MKHNIAYVVTAAIVYVILTFLRPAIAYSPQGIALPIQPTIKKHNALSVKILPPWHNYGKRLAWINVEYHQDQQSKPAVDKIVNYAKQLARQQGANGLVVQTMGYQPPEAQGEALAMYVLRGIAVDSKTVGVHN